MPKTSLSKLLRRRIRTIIKVANYPFTKEEIMDSLDPKTSMPQSLDEFFDEEKSKQFCELLKEWLPVLMEKGSYNFRHIYKGWALYCEYEEAEGIPQTQLSWHNCRILHEQQVREATTKGRELP